MAAPPLLLDPAELAPVPVMRFTVAEYESLIRSGALPEEPRHELLEGWITPKRCGGPAHAVAIALATPLLIHVLESVWRVSVKSAITTADSQPEPDLAVARGQARDFLERHPGPKEVPLVIEVADSSLPRDRGLKARVYARAGIPNYWIVNLVDRVVEVHSDPTDQATYAHIEAVGPDGAIRLAIDGVEISPIPVRDLLP
ncbi:Uma2 family endonuclease [Paludisphaera rhizosphaerae]|uniref:Uma2 family endonuclease n=1 Tax=Paludisphaera rhizosphaerae TaxID=2711216 RepID=UPI0013EDA836|nr:Uma2 family endonuclease [Paludisphaera rhizosphaerae]